MDSQYRILHGRSFSRREILRALTRLGLASLGAGLLGSTTGCASRVPETGEAAEALATATSASATVAPTDAATSAPATAAAAADVTPEATPLAPTSAPAETATATATAAATAAPTAATAAAAYLAAARGASPAAITRAAVEALGGMERFCQPGYDVIIKPNICVSYNSFEYAATTNPEVVATLVEMCLAAGADRVRVMDFPFGGTPEAAYRTSGIAAAVEAAGGEMEIMKSLKYRDVDIPTGRDLKQCTIYGDALEADLLINVPIAKHHNLARLTLGMKNLMGLIADRPAMHRNFRQRLPDLASVVMPALTVIDAVRILVDHGPTGGNLDDVRLMNTVIASHDIVAADAYATGLFGLTPQDVAHIVGGAEMGLGTMDLASVDVREIEV